MALFSTRPSREVSGKIRTNQSLDPHNLTNQALWQPDLKLDEAKSQIRNFRNLRLDRSNLQFRISDLRFRFVQFQNLLRFCLL